MDPEWNINMHLMELFQKVRENEPSHFRRVKVRFSFIAFSLLAAIVFHPLLKVDFIVPILLLCCIGLLSNLISLLWIMWGRGFRYNIYFATFVDILLITIALHYVGGIESTFSWIYVIVLVAVASLHGVKVGIYVATVSSLMYSGLLFAEFSGLIPHVDFDRIYPVYLYEDRSYLYIKLLSNYILFFITAGVSGSLSQRLIHSKNELENRIEERTKNLSITNEQLQQEITDRMQAEEALRKSEKRYRLLVNNVTDTIWILDVKSLRFTYMSPSVNVMRGYTVEEAIAQTLKETLTPASLETAMKAMEEELAPGKIEQENVIGLSSIELEQYCKDGSIIWTEVAATVLRGSDGQPGELLGVSRDITDRKRAEEALRENKQRLSTTLNAVPDMVYELALDGTVLYANEIASETLGIPMEKLGEITLLDLLDEEGDQIASKEIQKILETKETSRNVMYNLKTSDGRIIPVETHAVILERKGQAPTVLGVARDITEKKLLEQQLLQAQKMESLGTLAGGIAHDFNNILGGILGYASFMKSKVETDHPFFKYLDTIERSSTRAAELTAQLLGFARGGKYDTKPLDLNEAIKETLEIIERTIDKSIAIETQMSESLPMITADGAQLQQVLMNLFINAADAMPAGGKLTIETGAETLSEEYARLHMGAKSGSYVRLAVTDTGIGMDKENQKRIFEPFFTTKQEGKGTGLGLSMVYGVLKNHGGYIAVYSEPGHGTTFKIYMPVSGEAQGAKVPEAPAPHGRGELILVVDDEEPIRDFAKDVLEGNGYRVILAEDGVQAVRICKEYDGDISLVILDMVMPKMGGHEAFLRMRASNPKVKALLSTGYSQNGEAQAILDSGVKRFIQKPYQPNALLSEVRSVIDADG